MLRRALEGAGYFVISQADSRNAMETLKEYPETSLIVLDWVSPSLSGQDFLKEKQQNSHFASIPVIGILNPGMDGNAAPRFAATLVKPLKIELLLDKTNHFCQPS